MTSPFPDPAPDPAHGANEYTTGEVAALIAPLVGTEPDNVAVYAILVAGKDGQAYKCRPQPMTSAVFVSFILQCAALEAGELETVTRGLIEQLERHENPPEDNPGVIRDPRQLGPLDRWRAAAHLRTCHDVTPPVLAYFNSAPCADHEAEGLSRSCMKCGVELRRHQRVGAAWLLMKGSGLLADSVGTGKTPQIAALIAALRETGELGIHNRAVVVCKASAVMQWQEQLCRMLPKMSVLAAVGPEAARVEAYLAQWEVMVVSSSVFAPRRGKKVRSDGDVSYLEHFPSCLLVADDPDPLRNLNTKTSWAVKHAAARADRVVVCHGTPLQKRVLELYSFLETVGAREALGTPAAFRATYVKTGNAYFYQRALVCPADHLNAPPARRCEHAEPGHPACGQPVRPDPTGRKVRRSVIKDVGVRNVAQLRALVEPYVLRRQASDIDDVSLPAIQLNTVWTDLLPAQRERYAELKTGVLRRLREHGTEITQTEAGAAFTRAWQICSGLAALDDGKDVSAKLDWAVERLDGDLSQEKAVVFVHFRPNVRAMSQRLSALGIGHELYWSEEPDAVERHRRVTRFRDDPSCRVLVGTTSMEMSLNLQAARHLIMCDTILNPARMEQFAGRVRRQGSVYQTVYVHQLLARHTQEEKFPGMLSAEQAVADAIWSERSEMFTSLSPRQRMQLVAA